MRLSWIIWVVPKPNDKTHKDYEKKKSRRYRYRGVEGMWKPRQTLEQGHTEYQEPLEAGRGKDVFSPRASRGSAVLLTHFLQISDLQNCVKIDFFCFNPQNKRRCLIRLQKVRRFSHRFFCHWFLVWLHCGWRLFSVWFYWFWIFLRFDLLSRIWINLV